MLRLFKAFTLIETLIVVAIIGLLVALLVPALGRARVSAKQSRCLSNMRQLETAHWAFIVEHDGQMLGTRHGGAEQSWVAVLKEYSDALLLRSPVDASPHFEGGMPVDGSYRQTSYALNYMLSPDNPVGDGRVTQVARPAESVHTVIKVFEGEKAIADHVHPHLWPSALPDGSAQKAALEIQTNAFGGEAGAWDAVSNYGYLDGHAEASPFSGVYTDADHNHFATNVGR